MQQPRNPAMNCNSSDDKPSRKRRARVLRGLSTHETRAATRLVRTADLLSVRNHPNSWVDLAVLWRKPPAGARGCIARDSGEPAGAPHIIGSGGMAERSKAAGLKTVSGVTHSGVRIPLPPPEFPHRFRLDSRLLLAVPAQGPRVSLESPQ